MNQALVRHLLYPVHERLFGRETFRLLAELERTQWLSADALRGYQAGKLRDLLNGVSAGSAYYRRLFAERGIDTHSTDPFEALSRLPLLNKGAIRSHLAEMAACSGQGAFRVMSTGGSTGEPLVFRVNRRREAFDKSARMRAHRWFGVEPGAKEVYVWGVPIGRRRQDRWRSVRDFLLNDLLISAFDVSPAAVRAYLGRIESFDPECIFGYPSSVSKMCDFARAEGLAPRLERLRAVFVTGEVLDAGQRRSIESFFGVPVADGYGGRDAGFCAHQCPAGLMHVTSEHVIVEVVDGDGRPMPMGQVGELVVTNLDNLATPFIRYRTGDMGALLDESCPCGRGLGVIGRLEGRRTDHLVAGDGALRHALSVIYVLRDLPGVGQFQVHQRSDRSIDLKIVPHGGFDEAARSRAIAGVRDCLGETIAVRVDVVERIDPQTSGKYRHVVSDAADTTTRRGSDADSDARERDHCDRASVPANALAAAP